MIQRGILVSDTMTLSDGSTWPNTSEAAEAHDKARKEGIQKRIQDQKQHYDAAHTGKMCPIHPDTYGNPNQECKRNCALYVGDSCALAARPAAVDTNGKYCPWLRRCSPSCALYNHGCTLTNAAAAQADQ